MNRETNTFVLSTGDNCTYELVEGNHGIVCVIPNVSLISPVIPPTLFQDVVNNIISLDRSYIRRLYFDNVRISYRIITFQLYGHIRGALQKELQRPLSYEILKNGKDDYKWMDSEFLPKFPEDFDKDIDNLEKRTKNMYWAFKKGKVDGIPYVLPDGYKVVYNYFFELDPIDIKPVFDIYINTDDPTTSGDKEKVIQMLRGKFDSLDIKLVFKEG